MANKGFDKIKELEGMIDAHRQAISELNKEIGDVAKVARFKCPSCKKLIVINQTTYYIQQYYVEPSGCYEGAYYQDSEKDRYVRCYHCKRMLNVPEDSVLRKLIPYFARQERVTRNEMWALNAEGIKNANKM